MSEEICPLAIPGEQTWNPAKCKQTNVDCPHVNYYTKYRNCSIYLEWLKKLIRVNEKQKEANQQGGESTMGEEPTEEETEEEEEEETE